MDKSEAVKRLARYESGYGEPLLAIDIDVTVVSRVLLQGKFPDEDY